MNKQLFFGGLLVFTFVKSLCEPVEIKVQEFAQLTAQVRTIQNGHEQQSQEHVTMPDFPHTGNHEQQTVTASHNTYVERDRLPAERSHMDF